VRWRLAHVAAVVEAEQENEKYIEETVWLDIFN
jgi:hypothetical protein